MNLLTIADGFGDSGAYPLWYPGYLKWPELIQLITRGVNLTNLSRYGAGNEFIVETLRTNIKDKQAVLIQWAMPDRLDLLLAHNEYQKYWATAIENDLSYSKNVVNNYWISSNTQNTEVREYHRKFITVEQHQRRTRLYVDYAQLLLNQHNIMFKFMLTVNSPYLDNGNTDNWIFHRPWSGMDSFRTISEFADLDFGYRQPIPLIQFDYIQKFILPNFDLPWRSEREIKAVESMLYKKYKEAIINKPNDTN